MPVADAVRRIVALQAQEPASPYVALWNRVADFDPAELDAAFRSFEVVKATLLRITLHAVAVDDRAPFHQAMRPTLRAAGLDDERFRATGLAVADADALVRHLLEFAERPRSRTEIEVMLAERLGSAPEPGLWRALRAIAPLVHAPSDEPWTFGRMASYVAAPGVALGTHGAMAPSAHGAPSRDGAPSPDGEVALRALVLRYLTAFGPASRRDFAQFALLRQTEVRPAFEALADDLVMVEGPDGATLYDVSDAPRPDGDVVAPPRLLAMWDSVLLAYADRSRVIPPAYRPHVIRRNGDVLPSILVDGLVAGVWRPVDGGIEVTAFHELPDGAWDGIVQEAEDLGRWLAGRDAAPYGRYGHWWSRLPSGMDVRVLPHDADLEHDAIRRCSPHG